jgi:UDP-N-acetyl-alpha-D-muramoyl-L-alanyl-L-glutamate epimerase
MSRSSSTPARRVSEGQGASDAFVVAGRSLDPATGEAAFAYRLAGDVFTERLTLDTDLLGGADPARVDAALDLVHLVMGTSYYKLRARGRVVVERPVTKAQAAVAEAAYTHGLGEFAAVNRLPVPHEVAFDLETTDDLPAPVEGGGRQALLPVGGGKDSALALVVVTPATALAVNPTDAQRDVARAAGVPLIGVRRRLDPLLGERTRAGGLNGHVPVTAINSAISTLVAVLGGFDPVVFANERSADEETLTVNGARVNHQYSKSYEFERLFAAAAAEVGVGYFSLTRQLSELATVAAVANLRDLRGEILSCNRSYTQAHMGGEATQRWCLHCDKCLFTFLCFAVFLTPEEAQAMFGGDPLADLSLVDGFRKLWATEKPFDCVGERAESAAAMAHLAHSTAWGGHAVVRALGGEAASFAAVTGATVEGFLPPRGEHSVPDRYLASLQRVLAEARPPVR